MSNCSVSMSEEASISIAALGLDDELFKLMMMMNNDVDGDDKD